jgi:hypothetical protein
VCQSPDGNHHRGNARENHCFGFPCAGADIFDNNIVRAEQADCNSGYTRSNMKKAQGLPINTIILAVLALIVLVIIVVMVGSKLRIFGNQTSEASKGEVCDNICSLAACSEPKIGTFVDREGNSLGVSKVCCATPCPT